jgi:hypothetical protein
MAAVTGKKRSIPTITYPSYCHNALIAALKSYTLKVLGYFTEDTRAFRSGEGVVGEGCKRSSLKSYRTYTSYKFKPFVSVIFIYKS